MTTSQGARWQQQIPADELELLRQAVPSALNRSQMRSAAADEAYQDPDQEQHVYGTGMGRGAQKEVASLLAAHPGFRTQPVPESRRALVFLGAQLLFLHRVGPRMPGNATRHRLDYLPEPRRAVLNRASVHRYDPPTLIEAPARPAGDETAAASDVYRRLSDTVTDETLLAVCYSSTPHGLGRILLAPAQLVDGHYLQLIEPEELRYVRQPASPPLEPGQANGFNSGARPRTTTRLRPNPPRQNGT
jgi:hypothetical protein